MSSPQTITIIPASTQAGRETILALLSLPNFSGLTINAYYRDTSKAPSAFLAHPNVHALKGDIGASPPSLDLSGSDVVFYIPPPTYSPETTTEEWASLTADNLKTEILRANNGELGNENKVKRLVLFSAVGAQHDHGIGILKLNHITDEILQDVAEEVVIVRPGFFMEGFRPFLEEASQTGKFGSWLTPVGHPGPIVSLKDIAQTCATEIVKPFASATSSSPSPDGAASTQIIKMFGPRHYTSLDLQSSISSVLNKPVGLEPIHPEKLHDYFSQVAQVPEPYTQELADMILSVLPGGVMVEGDDFSYEDHSEKNERVVRGNVELVDAISKVWEDMNASGDVNVAADKE